MALFRGIQKYIALAANNITLVFDSGNSVSISGNIFLYPSQVHPKLYNYCRDISENWSADSATMSMADIHYLDIHWKI